MEFTVHRGILLLRASARGFGVFVVDGLNKLQSIEQEVEMALIWYAMKLIWRHHCKQETWSEL